MRAASSVACICFANQCFMLYFKLLRAVAGALCKQRRPGFLRTQREKRTWRRQTAATWPAGQE